MMSKLGFSNEWIQRIMNCVTSVSFSFLVNGTICGNLRPSRGLRQDDPLSFYLFLICAEGLSRLIFEAERKGSIAGISCCRGGSKILHLFFADNSMMFSQASVRDCRTFRQVLDWYASASGQVVNF